MPVSNCNNLKIINFIFPYRKAQFIGPFFYKINDAFFVVSVCTTQKWQQIGSIRVSGIEWLKATFLFSIVGFQGADF